MNQAVNVSLLIATALAFVLNHSSAVHAELMRQSHVADCAAGEQEHRLVFDVKNGTWWYPDLMAMSKMTRDEQNAAISTLNSKRYGNISEWRMASPRQVSGMKYSLADMATEQQQLPWDFSHLDKPNPLMPDPTLDDRTLASPKLAWNVEPQKFFTPTQRPGFKLFGKVGALAFNGRTNEDYWWRRNNDGGLTWSKGEADDHWMVLAIEKSQEFRFMVFNDDLHYVADDAKWHGFAVPGLTELGNIGAWIASTNRPEALGVMIQYGGNAEGDAHSVWILGREWFDVDQVNAHSVKVDHCLTQIHTKKDVNSDGIADLGFVVTDKNSCLAKGGSVLTGLLKDKYGPVAIRSCNAAHFTQSGGRMELPD